MHELEKHDDCYTSFKTKKKFSGITKLFPFVKVIVFRILQSRKNQDKLEKKKLKIELFEQNRPLLLYSIIVGNN